MTANQHFFQNPNQTQINQPLSNQTNQNIKKKKIAHPNQKIGRPVVRDQEIQFKSHFARNQRRFQIQAQLLVDIYEQFHKQNVQNKRIHQRVTNEELKRVFVSLGMQWIYAVLFQNNRQYYQNKRRLNQQYTLIYTSIIDVCYLYKLIIKFKNQQNIPNPNIITVRQSCLILLFYLNNQKLVNQTFLNYFMYSLINYDFQKLIFGVAPNLSQKIERKYKIFILIVMFVLEILEKQQILIQRPSQQMIAFIMLQQQQKLNMVKIQSGMQQCNILIQNQQIVKEQFHEGSNQDQIQDVNREINNERDQKQGKQINYNQQQQIEEDLDSSYSKNSEKQKEVICLKNNQ